MVPVSHPLRFLLVALAGWIKQQREVIDYLQAENRVLREQLGSRRLRFTDDQRIRLAAKAKSLGRRARAAKTHELAEVFTAGCGRRDQPCRMAARQRASCGARETRAG